LIVLEEARGDIKRVIFALSDAVTAIVALTEEGVTFINNLVPFDMK
jgi:hypothetical protein